MDFMKQELSGWKKWEVFWLGFAVLIIVSLSLYWQESAIGIISAISGVACVVLTGKGKRLAFVFGTINTILYAYISYLASFYGETMLNILYYLPMQFYGFYVWNKHMGTDTYEVIKKRMAKKILGIVAVVMFLAVVSYGYFLTLLRGNLAYIDSFSTVLSVFAMIISIKRYAEQWILWIIVNCFTIFMWGYAFIVQGTESIATLLMWCIYLVNAVIMYLKWRKEAISNEL